MVKRFLWLLLLTCGVSAHALIPTVAGWKANHQTVYYPSAESACIAGFGGQNGTFFEASTTPGSNSAACNGKRPNNGATFTAFAVYLYPNNKVCPSNSTAVTGGCQCAPGYDESGGQCVPHVNHCSALVGQTSVISWTEGYTRTPDEGDTQGVGPVNVIPTNICSGGCNVSVQKTGPGVEYYVSQQPTSQGLYRRSRDMPGVNLGTECTAGANDGNQPTAAEPACPGTVGMVGNKPTCVSTPEKPVNATPLPTPDKPPIAGNPAAGAKPPSGEGSGEGSAGRTPSAGTGGNAGGGAASAMGGKGGSAGGTAAGTGSGSGSGGGTGGNSSGSVAKGPEGTEQAACGAPGQPVCAVKVDESGMPSKGDLSQGETASDKAKSDAEAAIASAASIQAPTWSFSFQLPTGCTSYSPQGFEAFNITLNPCQWQSTIHDLMSMIWAAVTAFCIIGMVGRTIRES